MLHSFLTSILHREALDDALGEQSLHDGQHTDDSNNIKESQMKSAIKITAKILPTNPCFGTTSSRRTLRWRLKSGCNGDVAMSGREAFSVYTLIQSGM